MKIAGRGAVKVVYVRTLDGPLFAFSPSKIVLVDQGDRKKNEELLAQALREAQSIT